jgi:hypothetical protein
MRIYRCVILSLITTSVFIFLMNRKYHGRLKGIIANELRRIIDPECNFYDKSLEMCRGDIKVYVLGTNTKGGEIRDKLSPEFFWKIKFKDKDVVKMDRITFEYRMMVNYISFRNKGCFITVEEDIYNINKEKLMIEIDLIKEKRYLGYSFYNNGISDNKVFFWGLQMFLWTPELAKKFLDSGFTGHIDKYLSEIFRICKTNESLFDHKFKD